jgi:DNA-binding transcriptional ArsR family regulator
MRYASGMKAAAAIADPVRREILELLQADPASAGDIAGRFPISRPAVSRHLRVLRECGLVHDRVVGRRRIYSVDTYPLREIASWIARFDTGPNTLQSPSHWEHRLDALETEVARTTIQRRRRKQPDQIDEESA